MAIIDGVLTSIGRAIGMAHPCRTETVDTGTVTTTYRLPRRANELLGGGATQTCAPNPAPTGWHWLERRLEREYVWAADPGGYVDECVAQLVYTDAHTAPGFGDDTTPTVLYTLSDHNANVIGLTDSYGRIVAQYGYTPYGELRSAEYFTPDSSSSASAEAPPRLKRNRNCELIKDREEGESASPAKWPPIKVAIRSFGPVGVPSFFARPKRT